MDTLLVRYRRLLRIFSDRPSRLSTLGLGRFSLRLLFRPSGRPWASGHGWTRWLEVREAPALRSNAENRFASSPPLVAVSSKTVIQHCKSTKSKPTPPRAALAGC